MRGLRALIVSLVRNPLAIVVLSLLYLAFGEHSATYLAEAVAQSISDRLQGGVVASGGECTYLCPGASS